MIKNMAEMSLLYDFYGELLTPRQNSVMQQYYGDDYTLGEIAESEHISRQAVHDTVHKAEKALRTYEQKLGLVSRFVQTETVLDRASDELGRMMKDREDDEELVHRLDTIKEMIDTIRD